MLTSGPAKHPDAPSAERGQSARVPCPTQPAVGRRSRRTAVGRPRGRHPPDRTRRSRRRRRPSARPTTARRELALPARMTSGTAPDCPSAHDGRSIRQVLNADRRRLRGLSESTTPSARLTAAERVLDVPIHDAAPRCRRYPRTPRRYHSISSLSPRRICADIPASTGRATRLPRPRKYRRDPALRNGADGQSGPRTAVDITRESNS